MGTTSIEWTAIYNEDGTVRSPGKTWNPVTGCTKVSPGCDHCYAETFAERFRGVPGSPYEQGFDLRLWPERLEVPLRWKKPSMIFVNSMSDIFHQDVPDDFIIKIFETMNKAEHHIFQVLTKRPSRAVLMADKLTWTKNIWLGTSVELNQYLWRVDKLRQTPAYVKFISAEPLLGQLSKLQPQGIDWIITGAESGPGHRPMDEDCVRHLRDLCQIHHIAFFYKQKLDTRGHKVPTPELDGRTWKEYPSFVTIP